MRNLASALLTLALCLVCCPVSKAQDVFSSRGAPSTTTYTDQFSTSCQQKQPPNPYAQAGMDPLSCYGVMGPTDSRGQCSLKGMRVLQQIGRMCYYCQAIDPPTNGIIVPYDQIRRANKQGFRCGVDQVDPNCSAICTKSGSTQYTPPGGDPGPWGTAPSPPTQSCSNAPFDVRADVPDAAPQLRYSLGFERGFAGCLENQATLQNLAMAAAASRFRTIAALLSVAVVPGVIDAVLHPPETSANPNPYLQGVDEGGRLCTWALKISPAAIARCPAAATTGATCSINAMAIALKRYGATAAQAPKRFDCFLCTLAWLRGDPYTPPANGGAPWELAQVEAFLKQQYGSLAPQGPNLPCWRQLGQAKGLPGSMSPAGIEREMKQAGDGAQGFVFMRDPAAEIGHVFGVRTEGNGANAKVIFWDEQTQMPGELWFRPGQWTSLYRTK